MLLTGLDYVDSPLRVGQIMEQHSTGSITPWWDVGVSRITVVAVSFIWAGMKCMTLFYDNDHWQHQHRTYIEEFFSLLRA